MLSFSYFFFLLSAYFVMRPLREEMAIRNGGENLGYLYSGTFLAMFVLIPVFGWLVSRFSKKVFLPACSVFFISNLLLFWGLFESGWSSVWLPRFFYVWVSVFNLFIVSVFWSLMVDLFKQEQSKRLFPMIAAGGTLGAIIGPQITLHGIESLKVGGLLLVAAALLSLALICQWFLVLRLDRNSIGYQRPMGGSVWAGLKLVLSDPYLRGMAVVLVGFPLLQTFFYFHQTALVEQSFDVSNERVIYFAWIDLGANLFAGFLELGPTAWILRKWGVSKALVIMPLITVLGFIIIAVNSMPLVFAVVQAIRRGGEYGLMKPAREVLFTAVDAERKYKAKNVIDTFIYRGGDVSSAWIYKGLGILGMGTVGLAWFAVPFAAAWSWVSFRIGQSFEKKTGL